MYSKNSYSFLSLNWLLLVHVAGQHTHIHCFYNTELALTVCRSVGLSMLPFYASTDVELRLSLRMHNLLYTHLFAAGKQYWYAWILFVYAIHISIPSPYEKCVRGKQCVYLNDNSGLIKYIKHIFNFQPRLLVFFNIFWQQCHTTAPFTPLPFCIRARFSHPSPSFRTMGLCTWWMDVWQPEPTQRILAIGARCRRAP